MSYSSINNASRDESSSRSNNGRIEQELKTAINRQVDQKRIFNSFYQYFFNATNILSTGRLAWIDYAKGLTIFLVVYHHSYLTLINAGVKVTPWMVNSNLFVYSFRMPMFFMLSGLFITKSLLKRGAYSYIKNRARILLYPYLVWGVLQATLGILFNQYAHADWNANRYLVILYQPNATSQLWYLITLFNTALLYTLLEAKLHLTKRHQFILGIILYLISPFLFFNSMIQDTTRFYVYLVFGSMISGFILRKDNFKLLSSIKLFIPLSTLAILTQYYLFKHLYLYTLEMTISVSNLTLHQVLSHFWGMLIFTTIVIIGCAFILNVCAVFQRLGKVNFIRIIGFHSLYIYLMHVLIAIGLRIFFVDFMHYTNPYLLLPLLIATGVFGSIMFFNLCRHWGMMFLFEYDPRLIKRSLKMLA